MQNTFSAKYIFEGDVKSLKVMSAMSSLLHVKLMK